jgi:serine/threonine protein kinase
MTQEILIYIHNLNPSMVHRDINPKNIIIKNQEAGIKLSREPAFILLKIWC